MPIHDATTGDKTADPAADNPGVIAPPPLLFAGFLAVGFILDTLAGRLPTGLSPAQRHVLAAILVAACVILAGGALTRFRRAGTNVEPWKPTTALVTDGVYGISRNPIYAAMAALYLAVGLSLDSMAILLLLLPLLFLIQIGVIAREERYLRQKFGESYVEYMGKVRRWL